MNVRPAFDPFREHPFGGLIRLVLVASVGLLVLTAPSMTFEPVAGVSGDLYPVSEQHQVWRAVGPVFSVRFTTAQASRSLIESEVADLFPHFAARADSAELRYLLIRATRPVARLGSQVGVYRSWNFRYERGEQGWVSSGYW
ncbi:MAG: hypothetical protein ABI469_07815 [Gemmatimonadales bacterium]